MSLQMPNRWKIDDIFGDTFNNDQTTVGGAGGYNTRSNMLGPNRWNIQDINNTAGTTAPAPQPSPTGGGITGFLGKASSFMGSAATPIGIGLSLAGSVIGAVQARKAQRKAKAKAKKAKAELTRQEEAYRELDTSNPYMNMENTMEDLTINQKQAQFEREQFQQSQSNILDSLRGAAGGSGVAALAQQMAQSGQLASQRSAADIGRQEAVNQRAERAEANRLQGMEREGELWSRRKEQEKTETLFGMAQQDYATKQDAVAQAKQARMDAITGGIAGAANMFAGFGQGGTEETE